MDGWQSIEAFIKIMIVAELSFVGIFISMLIKDKKIACYFLLLTIFTFGYLWVYPYIRASDPLKLWRYITAMSVEVLMCTVCFCFAYLGNLIYRKLADLMMLVSALIMFCNFYRLIDRHAINLSGARWLITDGVYMLNICHLLVGVFPVAAIIYFKIMGSINGRVSGNGGSSSFWASLNRGVFTKNT